MKFTIHKITNKNLFYNKKKSNPNTLPSMNSNQLVKASDCTSSQETNRNPAHLIKARRNSWGKKILLSKSLNTQNFCYILGKKKNPKQSQITMHHKLKLAKSFYKSKTLIPIWQQKKLIPISKELFYHKTISFLRITKIHAHLEIPMHACTRSLT